MILTYREHEFGPAEPRMRVWTEQQAMYGQFEVVEWDDFVKLRDFCQKYPGMMTLVEAHD